MKFCYEAGPRGFALCRCLRAHGWDCILVCPSKIPRKPGERVKTDRRDADDLARLYRAGELTGLYVPEPVDEAMRDLIRARFQVGRQQHRARQQLKMYLLRQNLRYGGQTSWTPAHLRYLAKLKLPFPTQQIVFQEMLEVISEATARLERYDREMERAVPGWRWEPAVRALMSLRGMALLHAATLVAELGASTASNIPASSGLSRSGAQRTHDRQGPAARRHHQDGQRPGPARPGGSRVAIPDSRPAESALEEAAGRLPKTVTDIAWEAQRRLHHRLAWLLGAGQGLRP